MAFGIDLEDLVGGAELHALGCGGWPPAEPPFRCVGAELLAADAQHGLHVRQLEPRDVEQLGDFLDGDARRALHVHALERGAHLDFEEYPQQVRPVRAGLGEVLHRAFQVEVRILAAREMPDGRVDLRAVEPQLRHDLARGRDLRLRDAPVGLGHVPHDFERGLEESHADLERVAAGTARRRAATLWS